MPKRSFHFHTVCKWVLLLDVYTTTLIYILILLLCSKLQRLHIIGNIHYWISIFFHITSWCYVYLVRTLFWDKWNMFRCLRFSNFLWISKNIRTIHDSLRHTFAYEDISPFIINYKKWFRIISYPKYYIYLQIVWLFHNYQNVCAENQIYRRLIFVRRPD